MSVAWGKLRRHAALDGAPDRHRLLDHQLDVSYCFLALMRTRSLRRAAEHTAGTPLCEMLLQRLAVLVFLHDVGKANAAFQVKQFTGLPPPGWPRFAAGHSAEARTEEAIDLYWQHLPCEAMAEWGPDDCSNRLLLASIAHHGRPAEPLTGAKAPRDLWKDIREAGQLVYSPAATLAAMGHAVRRNFPLAFESSGPRLPSTAAFAHWFAGIVQLADWLGSDTQFFDYTKPTEDRERTAPLLAQRAACSIGLDAEQWRKGIAVKTPAFSQAFGAAMEPRPFQSALAEHLDERLVILESETGSGKTEAVLWRYLHLFAVGAVDGLYFALPTRAAASQLYQRLLCFTAAVWGTHDRPTAVRALAGYEAADGHELKARLADFKVLWADHAKDRDASQRWAAEGSKRFLAAPIAVGTVDQALLGALQVRHVHLRHTLLSRSLLVIDEVHASDAYMGAVTEHLLRAHLATGGHAVLLSATLGSVARARYQATLGSKHNEIELPSLATARLIAYPAISFGARPPEAITGSERHKCVHWRAEPVIESPESIAKRALEAATQGARVLVIRNTVPNAVATLRAVEALCGSRGVGTLLLDVGGIATLHHSRYSKQCRPLLDAAVEAQIGKHRSGMEGRIVIGTQTLEQSLDLDADYLITDLCPIDVLLQRIGRLHRHTRPARERPHHYREAQVLIVTPAREAWPGYLQRQRNGLGRMRDGGGVYPDLRILEATWRLIDTRSQCEIPADNRQLVEEATHPDALAEIVAEGGDAWRMHLQGVEGKSGAERSLGKHHTLDFDKPFDDDLPFADADESVSTRLGLRDRLVEFDPPQAGPFGPVRQLALRFHLVPLDLADDARPNVISVTSNGFCFQLGAQNYRYSRVGIERLRQGDAEMDGK